MKKYKQNKNDKYIYRLGVGKFETKDKVKFPYYQVLALKELNGKRKLVDKKLTRDFYLTRQEANAHKELLAIELRLVKKKVVIHQFRDFTKPRKN
jgi:hypothetical protein